jgi:hypothetical protein
MTPTLDGRWDVRRTGGVLPPMIGVGKTIGNGYGHTTLGPIRVPFEVDGLRLRYTGLLRGLVDVLQPVGDGFRGRSYLHGLELGQFELRRS